MKKTAMVVCSLCILFLWYAPVQSTSQQSISVTGVVKQPLNLTMDDLRRFESVSVRLNEVTTDMSYHGAFSYHGVPLRTILELATVQKRRSRLFQAGRPRDSRKEQGRTTDGPLLG